MSWFNAIEYCNRKSILENLTPYYTYFGYGTNPDDWPGGWDQSDSNTWEIVEDPAATGYRLPSTREWYYAARGGIFFQDYTYSGSNTIGNVAWYSSNSANTTHAVGTLAANEAGLYDMSGNVQEWCWGNMNEMSGSMYKNYSGGAWGGIQELCAVSSYLLSYSMGSAPTSLSSSLGLRICRSASEIAERPVFSPSGALFAGSQTVQITCPTAGAQIYYTTDGSEPTDSSLPYTGIFTISQSQVLKARAYRSDLAPSISIAAGFSSVNPASQMFLVPGGTYDNAMGSVTVADFFIDRFETSQVNYTALMGFDPAYARGVGADYPVYNTNWFNAIEYCNRRSMAEGLIPCYFYVEGMDYGTNPDNWPANWDLTEYTDFSGPPQLWNRVMNIHFDPIANGYRLPTLAEWEFAARGGNLSNNYTYSGSNNIATVAWYAANSGSATHSVGTKAANELGLYDMSGNVWEWSKDPVLFDPEFPPPTDDWRYERYTKGGSWFDAAVTLFPDYPSNAGLCLSTQGFRICRNGVSKVPLPEISPMGGIFPAARTVTISSGSVNATIMYTTDGSTPSLSNGTLYTGPFQISSSQLIKAIAFKTDWQPSDMASAEFIIDPSWPEDFVLVHGGTFSHYDANVTLSDYIIDRYELTQADYQSVMGSNPSYFTGVANGPVETVSWFDAIEYCNRRSMIENLTPCYSYSTYGTDPANWPAAWNQTAANHTNVTCNWTAAGYRLPTEMEWVFAAKGGNQSQGYNYSGSNIVGLVAWYGYGNTTHTVGTKNANELGIYDLSGNVREWTWDIYGTYPTGNVSNPTGPTTGNYRTKRNGSFFDEEMYCLISYRWYGEYAQRKENFSGFRVCRNRPQPAPSQMVLVAGGTFNNGTSDVTLSSFYIDKYELTQAAYQAVMGSNPATGHGVGATYPVYYVSWFKAIEYCNRRSMNEGLSPCYSYSTYGSNPATWPAGWNTSDTNHTNVSCSWTANGYRLPTEMEWMFAAKGGNLTHNYSYSGSNDLNAVGWYYSNSGSTTHSVGSKAANELGLFDMSGNVWEWVWDIYGDYPGGAQTDPHGATSGSVRVGRGGGFDISAGGCTVLYRTGGSATSTIFCYIGFRVVRITP